MATRKSSNREFGLVMAAALALVWLWRVRDLARPTLLAVALAFAALAFVCPRALTPLNHAWTLLGRLLHAVVSPVVLGVLYYALFTPFGFLFRLIKGDPLRLKSAPSYWIERGSDSQPGKGMANQF